ncbi:hypothetical protein GCU67_20345 [Modestobacter muralis]|uniref:Uncharacterized protein n=1 Tax=Modestobacter muralis TaxID=1608614 RepID=A0A6P0EZZ1_9ACTN|nr:hypothetical protein [Modestobacter muralis]NEK96500.1 hypothetical protein [Modestobacter muralis]
MAPRPQAAPSAGLRRTRPDDHAFVPAGAQPAGPAVSPDGAATAASRNDGTQAAAAAPQEALVKISTRIPPAVHRFIKVVCAEEDLTTQGIAVDALIAHLEKLGHPLPDDLLQMLRPLH